MQNQLILSKPTQNKDISFSLASVFSEYDEKLAGIKRIASYVRGEDHLIAYFLNGNDVRSFMAKEIFKEDGAIAALNSEYWSKVIDMTDVLECMPASQRNEWSSMIHDHKTPAFTKENVIPTLQNLLMSRESFLAQKVDGLFQKLSGNHVTNSPSGFNKRMIIEYVIGSFGHLNYTTVEYIHDLRSVIAKILGRDAENTTSTRNDLNHIMRLQQYGQWHEFDGGAFKMRLYKKGTVHMEVHPEIAVDLNNILVTLYPHAIPAKHRQKKTQHKDITLMKELLPPEVIKVLSNVADSVARRRHLYLDLSEVDSRTVEKVRDVLKFIGAMESEKNIWSFAYDATEVLSKIVRTGCLPEIKSHQFYPTQEGLAKLAVEKANIDQYETALEPSAGQGGIADHLPSKRTTCVEISDVNAAVLRGKGFKVIEGDFLKVNLGQKFNKIVMNPPFDRGQAERHVKHAVSLLEEDGRLVAILPASLRGKELVPGMNHIWSEVIERAFEDTGVRVVILTLE